MDYGSVGNFVEVRVVSDIRLDGYPAEIFARHSAKSVSDATLVDVMFLFNATGVFDLECFDLIEIQLKKVNFISVDEKSTRSSFAIL